MYKQQTEPDPMKAAVCPECDSNRLIYGTGKLVCSNCGHVIAKAKFNKFGAKRTEFNGKSYDSKFEASVAHDLEMKKAAKEIKDYETQYKVQIPIYRKDGSIARFVNHKVDFREHHNDGSFQLTEAKGVETADYKFRRMLLEEVWLHEHPDHTYTVIKQNARRR